MVSPSAKKSLKSDYQNIMKEAKKQPGLTEVMKVYGQYSQLLTQSQAYLGELQSTEVYSDSTSTT
jgi:hypothetical protein